MYRKKRAQIIHAYLIVGRGYDRADQLPVFSAPIWWDHCLSASTNMVQHCEGVGGVMTPPYKAEGKHYAAASSIFSIKIPYPVSGELTSTWVTAPMSLPS